MRIDIPEYAASVIKTLRESGFEAWAVGGCVRDTLLGRIASDWDVTTSALPDEVCESLSGRGIRVIRTSGVRHGTVTAVFSGPDGNDLCEITTYRRDAGYTDRRHPDKVEFVPSLTEDLKRRDFTVNAMATDGETVIDPFGGMDDLDHRLLRAVGNPALRFREDALRVLRGLRFASVLGFEIESDTLIAMRDFAPNAAVLSAERRSAELDKLLSGKHVAKVISVYGDILDTAMGIKSNPRPFLRAAKKGFSVSADPEALFVLYYGAAAPEAARKLRLSNNRRRTVTEMISAAETPIPGDLYSLRLALREHGENTERIFAFLADFGENGDAAISAIAEISRIRARGDCVSLSSLAVSGGDLLSHGVSGREVGDLLERALLAVMRDEVSNEKDAILYYLFPPGGTPDVQL